MNKQTLKNEPYYIGLDIGTSSVGWCCTDSSYKWLRYHGKNMCGVHLFPEAKTAEDRRLHRSNRRRLQRRRKRIEYLREIFADEINKVEPQFYSALDDSQFKKTSLAGLMKQYPTIFHLRKALIEQPDIKFDIRYIYLVCANILKHRGNFLYPSLSVDNVVNGAFEQNLNDFVDTVKNVYNIDINSKGLDEIKDALLRGDSEALQIAFWGNSDKKDKLHEALCATVTGKTPRLQVLLSSARYEIDPEQLESVKKIKLSDANLEEKLPELEAITGEVYDVFLAAKRLYDWSKMGQIIGEHKKYSDAMIAKYNAHKKNLILLKQFIKQKAPDKYDEVFNKRESNDSYDAWIGRSVAKPNKSTCDWEEFTKAIKKVLNIGKDEPQDPALAKLKQDLENDDFLGKQRTGKNGIIPYQLHEYELNIILENAAKHYPFLKHVDSDGYSNLDKIKALVTFKRPYYAGTGFMTPKKGLEKKQIYPWNFFDIVDLPKSAEKFIVSMTKQCRFIPTCKVLPKQSLLYSDYIALDHINSLSILGKKLSSGQKAKIWELCHQQLVVTFSRIAKAINIDKNDLGGLDKEASISLKSYHDFKRILGDNLCEHNKDFIEACIYDITIFKEEKAEICKRIKAHADEYSLNLSEEQIQKISRLNYKDWGSFSWELFTEIKDDNISIIEALTNGTDNFMQLLSKRYSYSKAIEIYNQQHEVTKTITRADIVSSLCASAPVKRAVKVTLNILDDIIRRSKGLPKKIFVEVPRESSEKNASKKGKKTVSRKARLTKIYNIKGNPELKELYEELETCDESMLKKDKIYLYFLQLGRDMYTGEKIHFAALRDSNSKWDVDHIYAQSRVIDDSLDNKVLTLKSINNDLKKDKWLFEVCQSINGFEQARELWNKLYKLELLSSKKREKLYRTTPLSPDELAEFNSRQLVETRQSAKAICDILKEIYTDTKVEIVYVNADRVSDFRTYFSYAKCRAVNDLHHARDAYLNIIVGNIWYTRLTSNPAYVFGHEKINVQLHTNNNTGLIDKPVARGGVTAWTYDSRQIVDKWMSCNQIQVTRKMIERTGEFYSQNPIKGIKCNNKVQIPRKTSEPRLADTSKYGGYDNQKIAYFAFIEYTKEASRRRTFVPIPVRLIKKTTLDKYISSLGYKDVRVILPKVLIGTKIYIDGYPTWITGKTEDKFTVDQCVQLILTQEQERYIEKIIRYLKTQQKNKKESDDSQEQTEKDPGIIDSDTLYKLVKELVRKFADENGIFSKRPNNFFKGKVETVLNEFKTNSVAKQYVVVKNIVQFCQGSGIADFSGIGGKKNAGSISIKMDITDCKSAYILLESSTGLGVEKIDLQKR